MRALVLPLALLLLGSSATPVAAQLVGKRVYEPVPPPRPLEGDSRLPAPHPRREAANISKRIDRAHDNGLLSRREARRFDREARQIDRLARRYGRDGLSPSERAELEARANYLRDAISARQRANGRPRS